ncbi:MAG TPA: HNH endonuclease signature motif containing protein [Longimicrobium sp.]|nr:HNH endonuclease signature motif containing protein [Longimicrobium sp.]
MNVLYYWRPDNYRQDARFGFGYHLNQNSPVLAQMVRGETVWAFTRDALGRYVLAAALVVRGVTRNSPRYRYGHYRVWGDLERTRYFDIERGAGAELLIRNLRITAQAELLAQSFQGLRAVRPLHDADHRLLAAFAAELPVLPPVGIYPEDEFEARLVLGSSVRELLSKESGEAYAARMRYLFETVDVTRARRHVERLQKTYGGRCQICRYDPHARYGRRLCHGHHIEWLSRGGADELENMVLICPNHHAAVHQDDAVFSYDDLTFRFSNGLAEHLELNHHLTRAA